MDSLSSSAKAAAADILPPDGYYVGVVDSYDGENALWTLRYDSLGTLDKVPTTQLCEIFQSSGCHEGGHLWIGKDVLYEDEQSVWHGKVHSFCPARLKRTKLVKKKSTKKMVLLDVKPYNFWRVKFENEEIYFQVPCFKYLQ